MTYTRARCLSVRIAFIAFIALGAAACANLDYQGPPDGIWEDLGEPSEGLVAVRDGGRWGYASPEGWLVIKPQFAEALPFSEGRAAVRLTDRWGYIDKAGRYLVRPAYADARSYSGGMAAVRTKDGWGYLDARGKMAIPESYDEAGPFSEGLAPVRLGQRWGYIREGGGVAIGFKFKAAGRFSEGLAPAALVHDDDEWGFIDTEGRFAIEPAFDWARSFSGGRAAVLVDGRWGYSDRDGNLVLNPVYEDAGDCAEEIAPVREGGLWGLVDGKGVPEIRPVWKELGGFRGGLARAVEPNGLVRIVGPGGEAAGLRASPGRPGRSSADPGAEEVIAVSIKVLDHQRRPVPGYAIVGGLGPEGEFAIPSRPSSDSAGVIRLEMARGLYEGAKELFGEKAGYLDANLEVGDHRASYELEVLSAETELPRLDEVLVTREGQKEGSNVLVQQEEFEIMKPGRVGVHFGANKNGFRIRKYFLQQGTKRVESESPDLDFEPGRTFSVGDTIHAGVVIDYRGMAIASPTLLKIRENEELKKPVEFPQSPSATITQDVKFLKGMSGALKLPFLKGGVEYEDDVITLYIGVQDSRTHDKDKRGQGEFKSFIEEVGSSADAARKLINYWRGSGQKPVRTGSASFSATMGALGYVSMVSEKDGLKVVGGKLYIFGNFGFQASVQTMAAFLPVYASIGVGGDITVSFVSDRQPKGFEDYFSNVTLTYQPYAEIEGGVGVKGVASVGVALHGAYGVSVRIKPTEMHGTISIDLLLRASVLFIFSWEYKLAGYSVDLAIGNSGSQEAQPPAGPEPPGAETTSRLNSVLAMLPGIKETDRDYLEAGPEWLGDSPQPEYVSGGDPLFLRALKTHILPGSEPLIVEHGGREFLFWTDDGGKGRASLDRAALMFSIRDANGAWSPGRIVDDDGTSDFGFCVVSHRGRLFAAWQNTTRKFGEGNSNLDNPTPIREMSLSSEILVAAFDERAGAFASPIRLPTGEAGKHYGCPRFASDGKDLALVYVSNSDGNCLLSSGENRFGYVLCADNQAWDSRSYPLRSIGKPIIGWDAFMDDGTPTLATAEDEDGNLATIDDRVIYLGWNADPRGSGRERIDAVTDRGRNSNPHVARWKGNPALFWFAGREDGTASVEYYAKAFRRGWPNGKKSVLDPPLAIGDDFSLVPGPNGAFGLLLIDEGRKLESAPAMIVYDAARDAWSLPSRIAKDDAGGWRAEAARAVWTADGRIDLAYRRLPASSRGSGSPDTTLELASTRAAPDLRIDSGSIYRYYGTRRGGELLPVSVEVRNAGLATARGIALEFFAKNEESFWGAARTGYYRTYKDLELRPGESVKLELEYRLPKSAEAPYNLFVNVYGLRGGELNRGGNYAVVPFAEPDLLLGDIELERKRFERRFEVPVENRSPVPVRDVRLVLKETATGETVWSDSLGTLEPYKSKTVGFSIDIAKNLSWKTPRKDLLFTVESPDVRKAGFHSDVFVLYNPYGYPAFNLAVFDARVSGPNYVWVSAAAANVLPNRRSGSLVIELLDRASGNPAYRFSKDVSVEEGSTAILSHTFAVEGAPSSYIARVSMEKVQATLPGAAETGGLLELGGDPVPVEVPVAPAGRN